MSNKALLDLISLYNFSINKSLKNILPAVKNACFYSKFIYNKIDGKLSKIKKAPITSTLAYLFLNCVKGIRDRIWHNRPP